MSDSTQETAERNPFTRPGSILAAVLVLALVAAVIVIFLVPKGASPADAAPTSATSPAVTSTTAKASGSDQSVCGLPSSTDTALGTAPKSPWGLIGTMAVPTDPATVGPGTTSGNGLKSCFAHSPTGALYAAANIWATSFYGNPKLVYQDLTADSPTRDLALKAIKNGQQVGGGTGPKIQIQGFIVRTYSPKAAVVDLAVKTDTGAIGSLATSLVWENGDWKLDLPAAGGTPFRQLSDLSGYISWAGV